MQYEHHSEGPFLIHEFLSRTLLRSTRIIKIEYSLKCMIEHTKLQKTDPIMYYK